MGAADRKAAVAEYKKRKAVAGIYAVRCAATGQVWVGRAPDIETIQTRLWFGLRTDGNQHPAMQKAWNAHGADSFSFEELELVDADDAYARDSALKDRMEHWRATLKADGIV
ncbi:MAG: GIY-YIG nuclease family protein [Rhizobiaceae bacterium]|nr:GIY-YIG nuclease family protein [Rhizobiaceae bacterium]